MRVGNNSATLIAIFVIGVAIYGWYEDSAETYPPVHRQAETEEQVLQNAFVNRKSDIQVEGSGKVIRVLPDDVDGSRHQRFILELASGQKVLVAHNIDLAPRIPYLKKGDSVGFNGEYEWNSKGGVIHWTHHDPGGRHVNGWLTHSGRTYQ